MDRIKILKDYLIKEPNDDFLNYALALEYLKIEDFEKAQQLFSDIKTRTPEYLPVYFQMGKLLESKKEIEKAIVIYNAGLKIAIEQGNIKTMNELKEAISLISELDE